MFIALFETILLLLYILLLEEDINLSVFRLVFFLFIYTTRSALFTCIGLVGWLLLGNWRFA